MTRELEQDVERHRIAKNDKEDARDGFWVARFAKRRVSVMILGTRRTRISYVRWSGVR